MIDHHIIDISTPRLVFAENFEDERGTFSKLWQSNSTWVKQVNISQTNVRGSVRGIHGSLIGNEFKSVTCVTGRILDIAVNLRLDDPDFGKVYYQELSHAGSSFLIPKGYGHGFQTLTDNCVVLYQHNTLYEPDDQMNISVFSPFLAIDLPIGVTKISKKDVESIRITSKKQMKEFS